MGQNITTKTTLRNGKGRKGDGKKRLHVHCMFLLTSNMLNTLIFDSADLSGAVEYTIPGILRICTVFGTKKSVEITYSYIYHANTLWYELYKPLRWDYCVFWELLADIFPMGEYIECRECDTETVSLPTGRWLNCFTGFERTTFHKTFYCLNRVYSYNVCDNSLFIVWPNVSALKCVEINGHA